MSGPYILFKTSPYKKTELIYGLLGRIEDIKAIWWQKKSQRKRKKRYCLATIFYSKHQNTKLNMSDIVLRIAPVNFLEKELLLVMHFL